MIAASKNLTKRALIKLNSIVNPPAVKWVGDFSDWEVAAAQAKGYEQSNILAKCAEASELVLTGKAAFARDGVAFQNKEYSFPMVSALLYIFTKLGRPLKVCDFGGALGDTYHQNEPLISEIIKKWVVVEQVNYVARGKAQFERGAVEFGSDFEQSLGDDIDVVLFSSVLQYLPEPWAIIKRAASSSARYILIDRTPIIRGQKERITVQHVKPPIYAATYPCRFFSRQLLLEAFEGYKCCFEWDALDRANIPSQFKGFLLAKTK